MTEKEKAKAYDEAIERAKKSYGNRTAEEIFPELKESEDERIKKNCIHFLELQKQHHAATFEIEECIAWIEKQDEQTLPQINERAWLYLVSDVLTWKDGIGQYLDNPRVQELAKKLYNKYAQKLYNPSVISNSSNTGKDEQNSTDKTPRFKVGDWIVFDGFVLYVKEVVNGFYRTISKGGIPNSYDWDIDNIARLWTIQDAKDGDVLVCIDEILLFKSYSALQGRISLYCWYNVYKNMFVDKEVIDILLTTTNKICPATKEQHDALMKAMNDAGYEWDAEKKELKKKRKR